MKEQRNVPLQLNWQWPVAIVLLWLLFAQTALESSLSSLTTDEPLHIVSGYSYLKTGDARLVEEHPLLIKAIASWPLLFLPDMGDPRSAQDAWDRADLIMVMRQLLGHYPAPARIAFASRVPVMWLTLVLAAFVYRWASDWKRSGPNAGLIALGLCALDPNIVAHGQLATTDIGVTLFLFVTWYGLWRWLRRPSRARLALTAVALGAALASKMSALIAVPVMGVVICVASARRQPNRWQGAWGRLGQAIAAFVAIAAIASLVVWAIYGFELRQLPTLPIPLPAASHLIPLARLFAHQSAGHSTFLWGHNSQMGWWYYFPIAFALKTPLPTLILAWISVLLLATAAIELWRIKSLDKLGELGKSTLVLLAFPITYFAAAMLSTVNLGYRHLLPVLPFVFVFAGMQISNFKFQISNRKSRIAYYVLRFTFYVLLFWYAANTLGTFPHHLAYFNELAGGPANGYRFLVDSNLDWGQSFTAIKSYLDQHGVKRIKLSSLVFLDPAVYGLEYEPLPPTHAAPDQFPSRFNPAPGIYAIGATSLQGVYTPDINTYAFFRAMTPTVRIGHALFVYDVPRAEPGEWVAQCTPPAAPLETEEIVEGFGRGDLRRVYFDCSQSWWYPANDTPGWYVESSPERKLEFARLDAQDAALTLADVKPSLGYTRWYPNTRVVFAARTAGNKSRFEIIHVARPALPTGLVETAYTEVDQPLSVPVTMSGPLAFVGFRLVEGQTNARAGDRLALATAWRVTGVPSQPISIMAHMVAADGHVVAVGDGLGVPVETWQAGDTIVQMHRFELSGDLEPGIYQVQTGVYRLDTLEHHLVLKDGQAVGNRLMLSSIQIR
ncbi:MAG: phospholipid carrier-dependent glycosyltransferase [Thermoflexales bacterium]|nr:phospholipid carrier-dependent glycosyltransferase [Thermoflexales bacterium]